MHVQLLWVHRDWLWRKFEAHVPYGCIPFPFPCFLTVSVSWVWCCGLSVFSGSVLTLHLSPAFPHRWVLSCVSNLWLSDSPPPHFLLLPWFGTKESGSGLIRYLQIRQISDRKSLSQNNPFMGLWVIFELYLWLCTHTTSCNSSLVSGEGLIRI